MHSDEMNKIEVRNVEKYPLFTVFYKVTVCCFFQWKTTVFLFVVQIE